MHTLQIRNLPEDVYEALSLRARREHRSLAQQAIVELRKLIEADHPNRRRATMEFLQESIRVEGCRELPVAPEALIREDRER